jgi:hypothetical protein
MYDKAAKKVADYKWRRVFRWGYRNKRMRDNSGHGGDDDGVGRPTVAGSRKGEDRIRIVKGRIRPGLERVAFYEIPARLQKRYNHRDPIYVTLHDNEIEWEYKETHYHLSLAKGFFSDLASVPWWCRLFGIGRANRYNWKDLGALFHDGGFRGTARFPDMSERENRMAFDALMLDLWLLCAPEREHNRVRRYWCGYKLASPLTYNPHPEFEDGSMMSVEVVLEEA